LIDDDGVLPERAAPCLDGPAMLVCRSHEVRLTHASCLPAGLRKGGYLTAAARRPMWRCRSSDGRDIAFLQSPSPRRLMDMPANSVSLGGKQRQRGWLMHSAEGGSAFQAGEGGGGGLGLGEGVMCSRVSPAFAEAQVRDA
jgi:hypothetical protein